MNMNILNNTKNAISFGLLKLDLWIIVEKVSDGKEDTDFTITIL